MPHNRLLLSQPRSLLSLQYNIQLSSSDQSIKTIKNYFFWCSGGWNLRNATALRSDAVQITVDAHLVFFPWLTFRI